ncbi:SufS family cysteine desulfurase [Vibrio nigripulchritudo]|uniref:SufS family cysteine desulfurase n=1 Tax=Vibrio nigripulchritudo TaxID=28173 RepID=UPI00248F7B78|nr:SufS family cysteine desulfurase [Vibrio nigripulchritudo]BDU40987.1 cysteine desulfurase [Vibrio nigripulchritudo]BDU46727.1 cysteine desulfurase [Vibrio nigripulchritudo]
MSTEINQDTNPWRKDFPTLNQEIDGKPLVYLDSAASAQTPTSVIDRMTSFYRDEYASVHRGVHQLSAAATDNMEQVRDKVCTFLGADTRDEIVFTKGTTEAINLVANGYLRPLLQERGDKPSEIVISNLEHHANIVPWQMLAEQFNLTVKVWEADENGELDIQALEPLLSEKTVLVAVAHISNVLGARTPIESVTQLANERGIPVLLDGAQAVMHETVDVKSLNCDFYVFSAHKLYGPTGIGVLYGKKSLLDAMSPWEGGGAMIDKVCLPTGTTFNQAPWKFEAGTPNIAGILGLGAAIDYVQEAGLDTIAQYENQLMDYALTQLSTIDNIEVYGKPSHRAGVIPFNLGEHHAYDVGTFLDRYGIAVRTGHHCAMPLISSLDQSAVCRASIALYTTREDIDALVAGLKRINMLLG